MMIGRVVQFGAVFVMMSGIYLNDERVVIGGVGLVLFVMIVEMFRGFIE